MFGAEDEGGLARPVRGDRTFAAPGARCEQEEAGGIVLRGLDAVGENGKSIPPRGQATGHGGAARIIALRYHLRGAGGVVEGLGLKVRLAKEALGLGQRLRMRVHAFNLGRRRPGDAEQQVMHSMHVLGLDRYRILQHQIVGLGHAAGV